MGMMIEKTETFIENVITVDNIQIGTVELCPERMEIARLNIFEPYQDKGYGTEVVKSLVEQGYKSLWVRADNARAIHVYEKCGFESAGVRPGFYDHPKEDGLIMWRYKEGR